MKINYSKNSKLFSLHFRIILFKSIYKNKKFLIYTINDIIFYSNIYLFQFYLE